MKIEKVQLYFLPVTSRIPYQFGKATMSEVVCARVAIAVSYEGRSAKGWGETPLNVGWVWPGTLPFSQREQGLKEFCGEIAQAWTDFGASGHPFEIGHSFLENRLPGLRDDFNRGREGEARLSQLAALVCASAFDLALYDAYGQLHGLNVYDCLGKQHLSKDLAYYLEPDAEGGSFDGLFPEDFLVKPAKEIPVWHSVGGTDPVSESELTGNEPKDDYPVLLRDWIIRDELTCLKIKLRGNDEAWDYDRLVRIGHLGMDLGVQWLCADYNCTAPDPGYVNAMLDRLRVEEPRVYGMLLYVEQPFPYELEEFPMDVHSIAARKPLFMDESAHDWRMIRLGRRLGWNNVALKTCKTQTGALLSLCWAKAHGMTLMVQDLTNPMLAMIPHAQLAAHAGTIMGLESNAPQFYPDASLPEAKVHPGVYRRAQGVLNLSTLSGPGFGYQVDRIERELPLPVFEG
ncbi:mandelate racemase/muconate lactonizing enzyme family protein [Puniceicoccus vermicola]|uniref:Mandelate racemase/muconate lactonizing enzyme family protein n=1 Tax=Puniceicoccus vermicola TaxID=388746 RepID=A0A7X1B157_9BACT|nr:mandelate racemase/muconate lactonizing enzyme family protein [Puniceicoccus vermicola]MBC2602608.1 mandelate racemase/muconate lactonizing enzyme family protein [Puniceicoccus vermicola]